MDKWKLDHANEASGMAQHVLVESALERLAYTTGLIRAGFTEVNLWNVVETVAQVVLARARGIDPDTLGLTQEEEAEELRRVLSMFQEISTNDDGIRTPKGGA